VARDAVRHEKALAARYGIDLHRAGGGGAAGGLVVNHRIEVCRETLKVDRRKENQRRENTEQHERERRVALDGLCLLAQQLRVHRLDALIRGTRLLEPRRTLLVVAHWAPPTGIASG
jgi:hypothetical protein